MPRESFVAEWERRRREQETGPQTPAAKERRLRLVTPLKETDGQEVPSADEPGTLEDTRLPDTQILSNPEKQSLEPLGSEFKNIFAQDKAQALEFAKEHADELSPQEKKLIEFTIRLDKELDENPEAQELLGMISEARQTYQENAELQKSRTEVAEALDILDGLRLDLEKDEYRQDALARLKLSLPRWRDVVERTPPAVRDEMDTQELIRKLDDLEQELDVRKQIAEAA